MKKLFCNLDEFEGCDMISNRYVVCLDFDFAVIQIAMRCQILRAKL